MDKKTIRKRKRGFAALLLSAALAVQCSLSAFAGYVCDFTFPTQYSENMTNVNYFLYNDDEVIVDSGNADAVNKLSDTPATCTSARKVTVQASVVYGSGDTSKTYTGEKTYTVGDPIAHSLTFVAAKAPTCTEKGNKEHYKCTVCNKLFSDSAGKNEITAASIEEPSAHSLTFVAAKTATCTEKGNTAHYKCTKCGKLFSDSAGKNEITAASVEIPIDQNAHSLTEVAEKTATCTDKGNIAHYKCTRCSKLFSDDTGSTEITAASVETTDPNNHDWGEATYEWSADFLTCIASRVCTRDASHTESQYGAIIPYVSKTPSDGQPGERTYTAYFDKPYFTTQTKTMIFYAEEEKAQTQRNNTEPPEPIAPAAVAETTPDNSGSIYPPTYIPAGTPATTTAAETTTTAEITAPPEEIEDSDADTLSPADEEEDKFADVDSAEEGDTITVSMGDDTVLPAEVLDAIKGKDIDLVIELENGVTWTINGTSIKGDVSDIDLNVSFDDSGIPVDVINKVTGERYAITIHLDYDGEFGFEAVMTIDLQKKNAGYYANLFYYNPQTNELEFVSWDIISEDGTADLLFTHASDYTIIIDDKPLDGSADETAAAADEVPDPEPVTEENPNTGLTGSGLGFLVSAAVIALSRKRRTR